MKNKGFTLIELLGVIVVLTIISLITIPIIDVALNKGKDGLSETQKNQVIKGLKDYYISNPDALNSIMLNETKCVSVSFLQENGYLPSSIVDPKTGNGILEVCIHKMCTHQTFTTKNGDVVCEVSDISLLKDGDLSKYNENPVHWKYQYSVNTNDD
ncbi:MAG: prepilin-type N-terminal cleavage/methylation domain-containing protein [Bacilli bacterium]|nr:prepilin-type N-terminal cleavage/methylation domain-containing protein [Bacilli bacterium]